MFAYESIVRGSGTLSVAVCIIAIFSPTRPRRVATRSLGNRGFPPDAPAVRTARYAVMVPGDR